MATSTELALRDAERDRRAWTNEFVDIDLSAIELRVLASPGLAPSAVRRLQRRYRIDRIYNALVAQGVVAPSNDQPLREVRKALRMTSWRRRI